MYNNRNKLLIILTTGCLVFLFYNTGKNVYVNHYLKLADKFDCDKNDRINETCCTCWKENFCFSGIDNNGQVKYGKRFDCSLYKYLEELQLLDKDSDVPNHFDSIDVDTWKPPVVTAVSSNHFGELRTFMQKLSKSLVGSTVTVYDLGLNSKEISEVKSWCNVIYKKLDFSELPSHVHDLETFAFKFVIAKELTTLKTFFYFDSSGSIQKGIPKKVIERIKKGKRMPLSTFTTSHHSVYAALDDRMLNYLPTTIPILKGFEYQTLSIVSDSKYTRHILKWFVLCAFTKDCITPPGSKRQCKMGKDVINKKMGCHRQDQALWNILQLNYLFHPEHKGALKYKMVEEWEDYSQEFINKVLEKRNAYILEFDGKVAAKRGINMKKPLTLPCN